MKKRILSCVLSAALLLGLTPWSALATDDPLDDQTSQTELQTNFQSPPQDSDIYADPQPNIQEPETPEVIPEVVPEVQTTTVAVQATGITDEASLKAAIAAGNTVTLGGDITIENQLVVTKNVTLNLNGNTLAAKFHDDVIKVESGATLTLTDSGNTGTITHEIEYSNVRYSGRGVCVNGGSFVMSGGTISGNTTKTSSDMSGAGVYVESGTFTMNGGTISDNMARHCGGAVYIKAGTFNMSGGTISGNTSYGWGTVCGDSDADSAPVSITISDNATITGNKASTGGGVYVNFNCTLTMTGGTITNNSALQTGSSGNYGFGYTFKGGGVYLLGTMIVSGTAKITDNTQTNDDTKENSNVCIANGTSATLVIDKAGFKTGATIGVSSMVSIDSGKYTSFITGVTNDDLVKYFTADGSDY